MIEEDARLPADPRLKALIARARQELAAADPLGAALLGGNTGGLPDASLAANRRETGRLAAITAELDALEDLEDADEVDRSALAHSLRRVLPAPQARPPAGAQILERHLLASLSSLGLQPEPRGQELAAMLESAPAFLASSREGSSGGAMVAGEVALAATKRLPQLLDLTAAAATSLPLSPALRQRIEAALGELLSAAAEDGGWLLKEYMPEADPGLPRLPGDLSGLGLGVNELESAAEALLADRAAAEFEEITSAGSAAEAGTAAFPYGAKPREQPGLAVVAGACRRIAATCDSWCPEPAGVEFAVEPQPSWLQPLLPPLSLAPGGPLSTTPIRLLVGDGVATLSAQELDRELALIHAAEYLPAAASRVSGRIARLLLPASESYEGWRALVLAQAPGIGARSRRELGWRAILALAALGLGRGRIDIAGAADLIAAESGIDPETARLQAVHVAAQPAAALTFVAGAVTVERAVARLAEDQGEDAARAALLAAGPLPGITIDRLGYTR